MLLLKNVETLRLYRDIIRATKIFTWVDAKGNNWSQVLRDNARKEFEQARYETDPKIIARLLFVGRDCLNQTKDKYIEAIAKMDKQKNEKPK